jgi:hypothetical protein
MAQKTHLLQFNCCLAERAENDSSVIFGPLHSTLRRGHQLATVLHATICIENKMYAQLHLYRKYCRTHVIKIYLLRQLVFFNKLEVYEVPLTADDENLSIYTSRLQHLELLWQKYVLKLRISYTNKCIVEIFHCYS